MKKVLLICSSDLLGIPVLLQLQQQNSLAAVAVPDTVSAQLMPVLQNFGVDAAHLSILTKGNLKEQLKQLINRYQPDAIFIVTFPWKISADILDLLPQRFINFHFGLLPKYKGSDPIFWQLRNREQQGGLSVHVMTADIDQGPIVLIRELDISAGETYGLHCLRLGSLVADAINGIIGKLNTEPLQFENLPDVAALFFKKPTAEQLSINWKQQSAADIESLINAANPRYGGAVTILRQGQVKLLEVAIADVSNPPEPPCAPGTIIHIDLMYGIVVACINNQFLKINVMHTQHGYVSGSKMFLLGYAVGEVFG